MTHVLLKQRVKILALGLVISFLSASGVGGQEATFSDVQRIAGEASLARADLLSPVHFSEASRRWQEARADSGNEQRADQVGTNLNLAYQAFTKAIDLSTQIATIFTEMIAAWDSAQVRQASALAPKNWEKGAQAFRETISSFEDGKQEFSQSKAAVAITSLRQAELEAIQADLLGPARESLTQMEAAKARTLAPLSYEKTKQAIRLTEEAIAADRYHEKNNRELANRAAYTARHALYLTEWITRLKKEGAWEPLILEFESYLADLANALNETVQFDRGFSDPVEILRGDLRSLLETRSLLQRQATRKDSLIGVLEAETLKLRSQSGQYASELEGKRQELDRKKRFEEKVSRIKAPFLTSDGVVLVDGDRVIIRLTGLVFASGKGEVRRENFELLGRVGQALQVFPERTAEVHGHTDSQGKEENNLELSQKRAQAVCDYLTQKMGLKDSRLRAVGYGSSQPVATNESAAGRELNRRLEIVLMP